MTCFERVRCVVRLLVLVVIFGSTLATNVEGQILVGESHPGWAFAGAVSDGAWTTLPFDDTKWQRGAAPLGFGEKEIVTSTRNNENAEAAQAATYFRTKFVAAEPNGSQGLRLKIRVDDGFVAYINGEEVTRWNLPAGPVNADTLAANALSAPEEALYQEFDIPAKFLRDGDNVLAVEVHQASSRSSDLFLDVKLYARQAAAPFGAKAEGEARELSVKFNARHYLDFDARIPDGFLDGGRGMQIDEFGNAVSGREIMRVDRGLDSRLRLYLQYARSDELRQLDAIDRATRIARYIDRAMTPTEGHAGCEPRSYFLAQRYASRELLLGDVADYCGAGVCRHRSLLFKLMADEAGLACALVRGNYGPEERIGGHAWNEVRLDDGTVVIVDVMNPQPDFYFPKVGESSLRFYRTVANAIKYPPTDGT